MTKDFMVECARSQVEAVVSEIDRIAGSEFPYYHSSECVSDFRNVFVQHQIALASLVPGILPATVQLVCNSALADIRDCLDLLGFLLRSTNVRNAFEAYGPLLRMASQALGVDTRLVISSEWIFSPFIYTGVRHLPNTVLVGLPATESGNPLLLPLAGHEFGHNAWLRNGFDAGIRRRVEDDITADIQANWNTLNQYFPGVRKEDIATDMLARKFWVIAWKWASLQCEEYFCDFFGLALFGESFLHAFAYFLAPYQKGRRSPHYPALAARGKALQDAASKMGIPVDPSYPALFSEIAPFGPGEDKESALLALADRVSQAIFPELIDEAIRITAQARLTHSESIINSNIARFALRVPTENAGGIANILTAAWRVRIKPTLINLPVMDSASASMLNEMVWKSIEIDEIEHRITRP